MEEVLSGFLLTLIKDAGLPSVVLLLWWFSYRDTHGLLRRYREDMAEQRRMYENNVELVRKYMRLAEEQQEIILLNTRGLQEVVDSIKTNQFCPLMRADKIEITRPRTIGEPT